MSNAEQRRKQKPAFDELLKSIESAPLQDTRNLPEAARIALTRLIEMRMGEKEVPDAVLPFFCDVLQSVTTSINAFREKHHLPKLSPDEVLRHYNTDDCDDPRLLRCERPQNIAEVLSDLDCEERSEAIRVVRRFKHTIPNFLAKNEIAAYELAHDEAIRQIYLQRKSTTTDRR